MSTVNLPGAPAAPTGARPEGTALLRVSGLAKSFGPTRALRSCSFELAAGEVRAIVGENGSGKSTLVKILSGVHRQDSGTIELDGRPLSIGGPRAAQADGIVTVFQEVLVVGSQTVLENIWLGSDGLFRAALDATRKRRLAEAALAELLERPPTLHTPVRSLSLSDRQACCIARALVRSPRVLILDEATSALDVATRDRLFAIVRTLCSRGTAVVFISHRMDEIDQLADRITVLRSGESVAEFERHQATSDVLVSHMTGSDQLTRGGARRAAARRAGTNVLLRSRALVLRPEAAPIDFELHGGELVGLAGLEGQGQDTFLHALRGAGSIGGEVIVADGAAVSSPQAAFAAGIAYVPRDRRDESLFPSLSIIENFAAPTFSSDRRGGIVAWRRSARRLGDYIQRLAIRTDNQRLPITVLSGGNQQKVIVARWLASNPKVLLLNDPTRGVDIAAKRDLYGLLERLVADGLGVVMLSTEVDEHVELMDRVLVFREGSVATELERGSLNRSTLVSHFFGRSDGVATGGGPDAV